MTDVAFITWEKQRRSITLARRLGARFYQLDYSGNRLLRYIRSVSVTFWLLLKHRHDVVIVQNPSLVLASMAAALKPVMGYRLVVDRHTDPYLLGDVDSTLQRMLARLSDFSLRHSDLTIVTNKELVPALQPMSRRHFILPDPYPELTAYIRNESSTDGKTVLAVLSWCDDEPIENIIDAARCLPDIQFMLSGRPKQHYDSIISDLTENVTVTGYLNDTDFYSLMHQADAVLAITTDPATLVCSGYESVSLGKPFITGDSQTLRDHFEDAALYSSTETAGIAALIEQAIDDKETLAERSRRYFDRSSRNWDARFLDLQQTLSTL